jgi:hypothetical protein
MIAPAPIPKRVATSDLVVVGKVTGFADKTVKAEPFPGAKTETEYQVAIVKVEETLLGKGVKEIKVGFIPTPAGPGPGPIGIRRRPGFTLARDQEACLFLVKHPTADFYIGQAYYDIINKAGNANFKKDTDEILHCAKLLADSKTNLASKNKEDRFLTAAMLLTRYRTGRPSATPPKEEPIDAAQSKAILLALADADWGTKPTVAFALTPESAFYMLGAQAKDGWVPPKDARTAKDRTDAMQKWLKDNADKFRIQHFVYETRKDTK